MDIGPVQADHSHFQHARLLCQQEHQLLSDKLLALHLCFWSFIRDPILIPSP